MSPRTIAFEFLARERAAAATEEILLVKINARTHSAQHDQVVNAIKKKAAPPQHTALGGLIYIHANGAGSDWTWGCAALENEDIRELYKSVDIGTPVAIRP